jgi:hypothetical protein
MKELDAKLLIRWTTLLLSAGILVMLAERTAAAQKPHHYKRVCEDSGDPRQPRCHSWIGVDENDNRVEAASPTGLGAPDLQAAYHLPQTGGNGRTIATNIFFHLATAEADLNAYRMQYGLPPCTTANGCFKQVDGKGGTNFPGTQPCGGSGVETALDIEMLSAGCPDCKIVLIEGGNDNGLGWAVQQGIVGVSFSWGGAERSSDTGGEMNLNRPGLGIFVATGDSGYDGTSGVQSYPASSANVVAVGGTVLKKNAASPRGWDETAWNGAGSGCSTVIPKPSWQTDTTCKMRMVADIGAVAEGVSVYCGGSWSTVGGTSAAAPFATGAMAVTGVLNGQFSPAWIWQHAQDLYDIASGKNGSCPTPYYCNSAAGYDGPTGNGSPNGDALTGMAPDGGILPPPPQVDGGGTAGTGGSGGRTGRGVAGGTSDAGKDANDTGNGGAAGMSNTGSGGMGGANTSSTGNAGAGIGGASGSGGVSSGNAMGGASGRGSTAPDAIEGGCACKVSSRNGGDSSGAALVLLLVGSAVFRKRRSGFS